MSPCDIDADRPPCGALPTSPLTNTRTPQPGARAQRIGQDIYDLAFIMDADGVLLELVHKKDTLAVDMPQAW